MISLGNSKVSGWYENHQGKVQYWDGQSWGAYAQEGLATDLLAAERNATKPTETEDQKAPIEDFQISNFSSEGAPDFKATSESQERETPRTSEGEPESSGDSQSKDFDSFEQIGFVGDEPVYKKLPKSTYPQVEVTKETLTQTDGSKVLLFILVFLLVLMLTPIIFTIIASIFSGLMAIFSSFFSLFGFWPLMW